MPTLFEIQTVTRQFFRVESELSVLKAMVRELVLGNAPPVAGPPQKDDQIEKGSPLQRIAALEDRATMLEHDATDAAGRIDALEKSKAPSPAESVLPPSQRPTYPPIALFYNGVKIEQPATEAPEPRVPQKGDLLNLHGEPVHFDGKHWVKGPTPANGTLNVPDARPTVTDRTVGLSGEG